MGLGAADIHKLTLAKKGAAFLDVDIFGHQLGAGTSITPDQPAEEMASHFSRSVGFGLALNLELKQDGDIGAYKSVWYGAPGRTDTPGNDAVNTVTDWTKLGRFIEGSAPQFDARSENDANRFPVYRGMSFEQTLLLTDLSQNTAASALDGTRKDIALERMDGTYVILHNVFVDRVQLAPRLQAGQGLVIQMRITASGAGNITDTSRVAGGFFVIEGLDSAFVPLNAHQVAGDVLEAEITLTDGRVITLPEIGFTVVPMLGTGGVFEGCVVRGMAYAPTQAAIITTTPAL